MTLLLLFLTCLQTLKDGEGHMDVVVLIFLSKIRTKFKSHSIRKSQGAWSYNLLAIQFWRHNPVLGKSKQQRPFPGSGSASHTSSHVEKAPVRLRSRPWQSGKAEGTFLTLKELPLWDWQTQKQSAVKSPWVQKMARWAQRLKWTSFHLKCCSSF